GPEQGTPIVAVHGFASDYRLNWVGTRWQETLTNNGFRVIGLDCRGHGESDKPHDEAAYAVDVMTGDVVRLLDHLGVAAAAYIGYSMGARIGLEVILDFPDRVTRAVLGGIGATGAIQHADQIAHAFRIGAPTDDRGPRPHERRPGAGVQDGRGGVSDRRNPRIVATNHAGARRKPRIVATNHASAPREGGIVATNNAGARREGGIVATNRASARRK